MLHNCKVLLLLLLIIIPWSELVTLRSLMPLLKQRRNQSYDQNGGFHKKLRRTSKQGQLRSFRTGLKSVTRTKVTHLIPTEEHTLKNESEYITTPEVKVKDNRTNNYHNFDVLLPANQTGRSLHNPLVSVNVNGSNLNQSAGIPKVARVVDPQCAKILSPDDQIIKPKPLKCYQCSAKYNGNKECESWWEIRRSEKYKWRTACTESQGHYCYKSVTKDAFGQRLTIRGCYGPGPLHTNFGGTLLIREGCVSFYKDDKDGSWSLTTACFCKKDLCNYGIIHYFQVEFLFFCFILVIYSNIRSLYVNCIWC